MAYATFGPKIKLQETNFAETKYLAYAIFGLNPLIQKIAVVRELAQKLHKLNISGMF